MDVATQSQSVQRVLQEVSKVVVGQKEMVEGILMGLLTGGHVLLEGVPGLAKTLTIATMAKTLDLQFQRIQFTPDLLPSDLIGTMILNPKTSEFTAKKGPIFTNIVLADEINRAPAKVQAALLEAMAEKQVTIGETTYVLEKPFLVLATQNPLEQEGTYALPEAQLDRFMFKLVVHYPNRKEEMEILNKMATDTTPTVSRILAHQDVMAAREVADKIYLDDKIKAYIVDLVMATRRPSEYGLSRLEGFIQVGVSPRATISLARAAKAHAFLRGRNFVSAEDIKAVAYPVLRHRLILTYEAEAESMTTDKVIQEILGQVEVP